MTSGQGIQSPHADRTLTGQAIEITDCTLREGEQSMDVSLTASDNLELAVQLSAIGVDRIQFASADSPESLSVMVAACQGSETEVLVLGFQPDWRRRVHIAKAAGVDAINFAFRSSPTLLKLLGWSSEDVVREATEALSYTADVGIRAVLSPTDGTRANPDTLRLMYKAAASGGAAAVYVCDTVGVASPQAIRDLVHLASDASGLPVGVHCHNDLGLALANALAGCEAGATRVDTCINGLGERCGNPSTDEVAVAASLLLGGSTRIDLTRLTELAELMVRITAQPMSVTKPIVGPSAFAQKMDIHVEATLRNPLAYVPFSPALVGSHVRYVVGKNSGPATVLQVLRASGSAVELDPSQLKRVVAVANELAESRRRALTVDELLRVVGDAAGGER